MTEGRTEAFSNAAGTVREPQFRTVQQHAGGPFHPTSVLDQIFSSGNGMASNDAERFRYGIRGSVIGQDSETFNKNVFLRDRAPRPVLSNLD